MDRHNGQGVEAPLSGQSSESSTTTSTSPYHPVLNQPDWTHVNSQPSPSDQPPASNTTSPLTDIANNSGDRSPKRTTIDPNLVSIITEQVLKQLQSQYNLGSNPFGPLPAQIVPPTPQTPDLTSFSSFLPRHTPSSSRRDSDHSDYMNDQPISPGHGPSITPDRNSYRSPTRAGQIPSHDSDGTPRAVRSRKESIGHSTERTSTGYGMAATGEMRASNRSRPNATGGDHVRSSESASERAGSSRSYEPADETTALEKAWGPLFEDGQPTLRLSQFLRGLANYLADNYEPKGSLVLTPAKMLRFFDETKVPDEVYPWSTIFGKMKDPSISVMYRKLLCQHHFVQIQSHDQPCVPGLTPTGFETIMICLIQAHPDIEFRRLARAVKNMPISNADDNRDRFPKDLSRRLFPTYGQVQFEQKLISSLNHEISLIKLEHAATTMPPPPPVRPPAQHSASVPTPEREATLSPRPSQGSAVMDITDSSPPALQLERQRKPYFAKERSGKFYDVDGRPEPDNDRVRDAARPYGDRYQGGVQSPPPPNMPALTRSTSSKTQNRQVPSNTPTSDPHRKPAQPSSGFPPATSNSGRSGPGRRSSTPPRYNHPRGDQFGAGSGGGGGSGGSGNDADSRRYADGRPLERARTANDDPRSRSRPGRNPVGRPE